MKNAEIIAEKLEKIGRKTYVVGSYNVHALLHKNFGADIDLTTPATPDEIRSTLRVVGEIGSKFGTLIVKEGGEIYEITTFRKDIGSVRSRKPKHVEFTESLEEDAKRRDFTFNAIYYDILKKKYIDPVGGIDDLKDGIIRFVGNPEERLEEDVLRLLRYVRLKNKYGLKPYDEKYHKILSSQVTRLRDIAKERIKQELDKMLLDKTNVASMEELRSIGFFRLFIPQLDNLYLTPGGKLMHLEGSVWTHTLMALEELNKFHSHDIDLYWAVLFHDIGKYPTYSYDEDGNVHYYRHEQEGTKIIRDYLAKSLYFSKNSIKKILWLVENHIRVGTVEFMRKAKRYRFMMHPYFQELIYLYIVDNLGKDPPDEECGPRLQIIYDDFKKKLEGIRFLTGSDILKKYPDLQGGEIGRRIRMENDRILSRL